ELIRGASGDSLVTARVVNNLQIFADGGDIIFDTAGDDNDWDGTANDGQLNALNGDITLRDNQDFDYSGAVFIGSGHEVYTIGFSIEMQPGSLLDLTGGTFRQSANRGGHIGGELVVDAGADSALKTDSGTGSFVLEATSEVTLNGNLRLDSRVTSIEAGAMFSGTGRLINVTGRELAPDHLADIGVIVENQGVYANSESDVGRNDMLQFVQTASGTFQVDLEGTDVSQYDRLQVDGQAQLAGALELVLDGGYVPASGDTLNIVSAAGGIAGTFANVIQPVGMPAGLIFDVIYNPTLVQLTVVPGMNLPGDYNLDGTVDAADYVVWRKTDGTQGGYNAWRANYGRSAAAAAAPPAANIAVPEANCLLLLSIAIALLSGQARTRLAAPISRDETYLSQRR
ncbi:MAG TPA: hypothetical protein VJ828_15470, partial [Lacipirellulaceae bacterium]|nr:hypothetical protein [Lacipirellulaceae bacterium]